MTAITYEICFIANAGVPMIYLALPPMAGLIIPVIIIEALYAKETLNVISKCRCYSGILIANLISTFIGWPLAWVTLVAIELATGGGSGYGLESPIQVLLTLTLGAAWLVPYSEAVLSWLIPSAMVVLLIPFFFVSVYSERIILLFAWKHVEWKTIKRFSWRCHLASYGFLLSVVIFMAIYHNIKN